MNWCQRARLIPLVISCLLFAIWATSAMSADPKGNLHPTMQSLFQALTIVFPLSLDEEAFRDAANRQPIQDGLQTIARSAAHLSSHGDSVPPSFDFLQQSLTRNAQEALALFEAGQYWISRLVFQQLLDNCFLCHSQLPSTQSFKLGQQFLDQLDRASLPPYEQIQIAVATRQFDTALKAFETLFQSRSTPPAQIDLMAFFEDYLRLVIRVHHDFPRAVNTLEAFQKRPDVPHYLREHITTWVAALNSLQHNRIEGDELSHARALIKEGQQRNRFLSDRQGLIHFVVASSVLHRYVSNDPKSPSQLSEAYYLLGVTGSYIPQSSWISETDYFLERAIRLAPNSKVAKTAYSVLEESVMTKWTSLDHAEVPSVTRPLLSELRKLIDGS